MIGVVHIFLLLPHIVMIVYGVIGIVGHVNNIKHQAAVTIAPKNRVREILLVRGLMGDVLYVLFLQMLLHVMIIQVAIGGKIRAVIMDLLIVAHIQHRGRVIEINIASGIHLLARPIHVQLLLLPRIVWAV
jgi:hypothetical protein